MNNTTIFKVSCDISGLAALSMQQAAFEIGVF